MSLLRILFFQILVSIRMSLLLLVVNVYFRLNSAFYRSFCRSHSGTTIRILYAGFIPHFNPTRQKGLKSIIAVPDKNNVRLNPKPNPNSVWLA